MLSNDGKEGRILEGQRQWRIGQGLSQRPGQVPVEMPRLGRRQKRSEESEGRVAQRRVVELQVEVQVPEVGRRREPPGTPGR